MFDNRVIKVFAVVAMLFFMWKKNSKCSVLYVKIFFILLLFSKIFSCEGITTGIVAMSAVSSINALSDENSFLGKFFSGKVELELEQVMLVIDDDMNHKSAVKLHIVVVYEQELIGELRKMSSNQYFSSIKQISKDHPDKIKVFEWKLVAKKRITKWIALPHNTKFLTPLAGFVFASYSSPGEHRAVIPSSWDKMKILLGKNEFEIKRDSANFSE
jgi:hypothetical protein